MQALNVEDNTDGLRQDKVILAIDADAHSMHSWSRLSPNILMDDFARVFISSKPARRLSYAGAGSFQRKEADPPPSIDNGTAQNIMGFNTA